MNDRRLESLIRMAGEIEELERSAAAESPLRIVHAPDATSRARRRPLGLVWRIAPFAAAAACVGLAVMFARSGGTPAGVPGTTRLAEKPPVAAPERIANATEKVHPPMRVVAPRYTAEYAKQMIAFLEHPPEVATGVLAIYEDSAGVVRCVRWHPHDFGARGLDQLSPGELVRVSYGQHCAVVGPHRLIAVAVRGPVENLPISDERAQKLAECIVGEVPSKCGGQMATEASEAVSCLPTGLQMAVETLAMGKP
jgi:hypothetical protein